ncbi:hypothetical protein OG896_00515 [Streptomyces sp. NBC_00669]|uniref:hypothetical protein n=1 Tax=Streptomyces sp. NBC_00669 TaxID=2976011 RepID=UPI002E357A91|nr:hypothetical protein [Streptomyces sp. NBC_00669]
MVLAEPAWGDGLLRALEPWRGDRRPGSTLGTAAGVEDSGSARERVGLASDT